MKPALGKRETDKMTLAKFGKTLSTLMKTVDDGITGWLTRGLPAYCPDLKKNLEMNISDMEAMEPEYLKILVLRFLDEHGFST